MLLLGAACQRQEVVHVSLQAQTPTGSDLRRFEIRAQVAGVQSGLRYKWLAEFGECDPQESNWPSTIFRFAENTQRDHVTVEVWRENNRLAHERIDLEPREQPTHAVTQRMPAVQIEISLIPPFEPHGGPDTRGEIAGKVSGEVALDQKVILYARADQAWYIQPAPYVPHVIRPDHTWSSWTHTGSDYAALVVRPGFTPALVCDVLPQIGGDVLARSVVEGSKK